jgi:hypothetical protein
MKITKGRIKQIIQEELQSLIEQDDAAPEATQRGSRVAKAADSGGMMPEEEYLEILKGHLMSDKATDLTKVRVLDALFDGKGRPLLALLKKSMGGE